MIEIKVNDEIRDVKAELAIGLTGSQLLWIGIGVAAGFAAGWCVYRYTPLPLIAASYIAMIPAAPFGLMAFKTWHEMTAFETAKLFFIRNILDPKVKTYGGKNEVYCQYMKAVTIKQKLERKQNKRRKLKKERNENIG